MYNVEFQRAVLKLLCVNRQFALNYGLLLKPDYLDSQPMRQLYDIINNHIIQYDTELDQSSMLVSIDNYVISKGYSTDTYKLLKEESRLMFVNHIKSEQFVIDKLIKFIRRQEMKGAMLEGWNILEQDGSYEHALKLIDEAVSIGTGVEEGSDYEGLKNVLAEYKHRYNPSLLVRTGFSHYDQSLMGGMAPGELHIVQAPPKSGKSTWACNVGAYSLVSGTAVFHVTLELKVIDIMAKYCCRLTGTTYRDFMDSDINEFKKKMDKFDKYSPNLFVNYYSPGTTNAHTIRSWASRIRSKTGVSPGLFIIDYDDCLVPIAGSKDDMYNDAGAVYDDLISLADYFSCPVLSLAQPKREAWNKPSEGELIVASDLAHSAKKAHKTFSVSSLNFGMGNTNGILYMDMIRRGNSDVRVNLVRDLNKATFKEK